MISAVVTIGAVVTLACCIALVFHPDYDDGLLGRAGLFCVGVAAFARVMALTAAGYVHPTPIGVLLWVGVALFLGRHTWCFLRRSSRRDATWYARPVKAPAMYSLLRRRGP